MIALPACRKDPAPEPGPSGGGAATPCVPLPSEPPFGWNYWLSAPFVWAPRWNPNDPNEFIILEYRTAFLSKLWKYNLSTHEVEYLIEGQFLASAEWGASGWILLNFGWPANIFKIKANGDSLTQLTFDAQNFGGEWNYWGDTIVYYHADNSTRIMLADGSFIQELPNGGGYAESISSWRHPAYLVNPSSGLYIFNPYEGVPVPLISEPSIGNYYRASFVNDLDRIVWTWNPGLHTTSIATHETVLIEETCSSNAYSSVDCHPLNNKLLLARVKQTPNDPVQNVLKNGSSVVIMNLDGSDKQIISIPFPE